MSSDSVAMAIIRRYAKPENPSIYVISKEDIPEYLKEYLYDIASGNPKQILEVIDPLLAGYSKVGDPTSQLFCDLTTGCRLLTVGCGPCSLLPAFCLLFATFCCFCTSFLPRAPSCHSVMHQPTVINTSMHLYTHQIRWFVCG
jgi:hypothetical protein